MTSQFIVERDRPDFVYAVGDIHGCLLELRNLQAEIAADCALHGRPALIVYLGDYIDRGDNSAGVLDNLTGRRVPDHDRICLMGNHEQMFLDFIDAPRPNHGWLRNGGDAALRSYGLDAGTLFDGGRRRAEQKLISHIPAEHLDFLGSLPVCVSLPGLTLVHAGLVPGIALAQQLQEDMLWMRPDSNAYADHQPFGLLVHGHTPSPQPVVEAHRICVDTGAYATGILTAVRIGTDGETRFISASREKSLPS